MKISYKHLIENIDEKPTLDDISKKLLQLGHEHEIENNIFDLEITPNRGDCLSLNGILRDLSVFYSINKDQAIFNEEIENLSIRFENLSKEVCSKISFLKIEIEDLPSEYNGCLENYFIELGLNKNNFFTDVSNYISYETGQPTHCYDAQKINNKISLNLVDNDHEFETLLGKKISLKEKNAVFLQNDEVINLAGVMGGKNTACSDTNKSVLVECAFFNPEFIMGQSIKYDIQSEAAHKFERRVDPDCHNEVLRRFIKIVSDHANITKLSIVTYDYQNTSENKILIDFKKINHILGIDMTNDEYVSYLKKLGFKIDRKFVIIPSYRSDIKTQNDLAEEIARVIGYDNIPTSELKIHRSNNEINQDVEKKIKSFLVEHGFHEVINSPFVNNNDKVSIKVDNPLDSNRQNLRTNLLNSLILNLLSNERRQKESIKLFEISDVYSSNKSIQKKRKLALIASGRVGLNYRDFSRKINKKYLSSIFKKLSSDTNFDFQIINRQTLDTKIKSEILGLEIDLDSFLDDVFKYEEVSKPPTNFIKYNPISELPSSFKDISFSIKDFSNVEELQNLIFKFNSEILKDVFIFDYFKNEMKKEIKIGFRFIFQSKKETLTSIQIENVLNDIIKKSILIKGISVPGINLE
tara:strand:+ start:274 stop:2187 length:1914 start_codon:yes stop_codon:yes gene_type:complete